MAFKFTLIFGGMFTIVMIPPFSASTFCKERKTATPALDMLSTLLIIRGNYFKPFSFESRRGEPVTDTPA